MPQFFINTLLVPSDVFLATIAIMALGVSLLALLIAYFKLTYASSALYSEILGKTMHSLHDIYDTEGKLETKNDCELYAVKLLDTMSFLAHIASKKTMDKKMPDFLEYDFSVAKRVMEWFDKHNLGAKYGDTSPIIWSNLEKYYKSHRITTAKDEVLPDALAEFENLDSRVFIYGTLLDDATRAHVVGRIVRASPETLPGYEISDTVKIEGIKYPAASPNLTKSLNGAIITLSQKEIGRLDEWETSAYRRVKVVGSQKAWMYVKN